MFNTIKICPNCDFQKKYDKNRDDNIEKYKYCPMCRVELKEEAYSPF